MRKRFILVFGFQMVILAGAVAQMTPARSQQHVLLSTPATQTYLSGTASAQRGSPNIRPIVVAQNADAVLKPGMQTASDPNVTVTDPSGKTIVTFNKDGTVAFDNGFVPDAKTKMFWSMLGKAIVADRISNPRAP